MISKLEDFDYTMEQSEEGYKILQLLNAKLNLCRMAISCSQRAS